MRGRIVVDAAASSTPSPTPADAAQPNGIPDSEGEPPSAAGPLGWLAASRGILLAAGLLTIRQAARRR